MKCGAAWRVGDKATGAFGAVLKLVLGGIFNEGSPIAGVVEMRVAIYTGAVEG